jgi:hypothetical protein
MWICTLELHAYLASHKRLRSYAILRPQYPKAPETSRLWQEGRTIPERIKVILASPVKMTLLTGLWIDVLEKAGEFLEAALNTASEGQVSALERSTKLRSRVI